MSSKHAPVKHRRRWRFGPVDAAPKFTEDSALYSYVPSRSIPPVLDGLDSTQPDPRFASSILSRAETEGGVPFYTVRVWRTYRELEDEKALDRGEVLPLYLREGEKERVVEVYAEDIRCIASPRELQRFEHDEFAKAQAVLDALAAEEAAEVLAAVANDREQGRLGARPLPPKRRGRPSKKYMGDLVTAAPDVGDTSVDGSHGRPSHFKVPKGLDDDTNDNATSASVSEGAVFFDTHSAAGRSESSDDELADRLVNHSFITASARAPAALAASAKRRQLAAREEDEERELNEDGEGSVSRVVPSSSRSSSMSAAALLAEFKPKAKARGVGPAPSVGHGRRAPGQADRSGEEVVYYSGSSAEDDIMDDDSEDEGMEGGDGYGAGGYEHGLAVESSDDELAGSSPTITYLPERRMPP